MASTSITLPAEFVEDARKILDLRIDIVARRLYSTDASIYEIEPFGVAFPRTVDEISGVVGLAAKYQVPVLARGSGSSLAGQAIGQALILDCARHLNHIIEINPEKRTAVVEPGVILNTLNRATARYGLQFGPDPASAERATMGGSLANNATGAHSIIYGMAADHILSADVVLSDGSLAKLSEISLDEIMRIANIIQQGITSSQTTLEKKREPGQRLNTLLSTIVHIRDQYMPAIQKNWPHTWRRASGYSLNYLLPWSPSQPPLWNEDNPAGLDYPPVKKGDINLAALLCGSEGTLAVICRANLRLVPLPKHTILCVLAFDSLAGACDVVPELLEHKPSAIELIPRNLVRLARSVPAYARMVSFVDPLKRDGQDPAAMLVVEFSGYDPVQLKQKAHQLGPNVLLAETAEAQKQVWGVRKAGLGILLSIPGDIKPYAFIEDLAVPVDHLGEFVREMERMLAEYSTEFEIYAHASAGCLHIRPLINLKTTSGVANLRAIAERAVDLTLRLSGATSGEHGDGLARGEWLERAYGPQIMAAFRELKEAADPQSILNPGKIVGVQPMDVNLRYGPHYSASTWQPVMDYGSGSFQAAIEQCNGAGVCRKSEGVMCPSFMATQEEMHSTRGRANLLRALISGHFPTYRLGEEAVHQALDLCLACKGCKAECPSAVDMAKLKYEFTDHYYHRHPRKLRDYVFGYIGTISRLSSPFAPIANAILGWGLTNRLLELAPQRQLPRFAPYTFTNWFKHHKQTSQQSNSGDLETVLFLCDAFTEYFYPEVGAAAIQVLEACGCHVQLLPVMGAGRTLISKGFLKAAKNHARRVVEAIEKADPPGRAQVVGVEPSEIYTLRDEFLSLLPSDERIHPLSERAWMIDEFLMRPGQWGHLRLARAAVSGQGKKVLLHGHCYQKAQPPAPDGFPVGAAATLAMLKAAGYQAEMIESTCCGMAGAFGYESDHYDVSMQVGELSLLPAVRQASPDILIAASGVSCQAQIQDGAGRKAMHPVLLIKL